MNFWHLQWCVKTGLLHQRWNRIGAFSYVTLLLQCPTDWPLMLIDCDRRSRSRSCVCWLVQEQEEARPVWFRLNSADLRIL